MGVREDLKQRLGPKPEEEKAAPKEVTIAVIPEGPSVLGKLKEALEESSKVSAKRLEETEALWKAAKEQSEPVCCFCHKTQKKVTYLVQGYAPDKRPIFICSGCVIYSMQILQRNKVKVGPTF